MNRANQLALNQATNQAVMSIRQLEIKYYTNLYNVFGTQAILMGGFVYNTFTQNDVNHDDFHVNVFLYAYYVSSAVCIATAVHIMLCTMVLQVYGPGLAIHGPLGSMARAAENLSIEQDHIVTAFVIMAISFMFSTIFIFWTIMILRDSLICTFCYILIVIRSYYYCERIYLRFYWNKSETDWNNGAVQSDFDFDEEPRVPDSSTGGADKQPGNSDNTTSAPPQYKQKKFRLPFGLSSKKAAVDVGAVPETSHAETAISGDAKGVDLGASHTKGMVAMEGYFTTRGRSEQQVILESRRWERQYFVLFRTGEFYVYKARQNFRADPKSPVYNRPVRLADFHVKVNNTDQEMRSEYEDDGRSVASTAITVRADRDSKKPLPFRFQITLVPRENEEAAEGMGTGAGRPAQLRNQWLLRCDTEEELEIWLGSIRDVCPGCFVDT